MMVQKNSQDFQVFAIAAVSADGFIASYEGIETSSTQWTSKEDLSRFLTVTKRVGAIVMGSTTLWATHKPGLPLPKRRNYILTKDPAKLWRKYEGFYPEEKIAELKNNPDLVFLAASPEGVIAQAKKDRYSGVVVCGGASVYTAWLPYIQTLYLTRENAVTLKAGLPLFYNQDGTPMNVQQLDKLLEERFELVSSENANESGTVLQEWRVK